jgi:hypothetical protein
MHSAGGLLLPQAGQPKLKCSRAALKYCTAFLLLFIIQ